MNYWKDIAKNIRVHGHTVWLCARDREIGWPVRLFALVIAGYGLSPIDLIPDFIPIIGLLDDAILIPLGIWLLCRMIPNDIYARNRTKAEAASTHPVSKAAAVCITALWVSAAAFIGYKAFG